MAEAFVALGIAANIAQFVGYGLQLISQGKEIYSSVSGARDEHKELQIVIEDIKNLSNEVALAAPQPGVPSLPLSNDEKAIQQLADECKQLADKLLRILGDLKVPKDARFRGLVTARQTLRSAGKKKELQELENRLQRIDGRLRTRVTYMLQKNNHSDVLYAIKNLSDKNERMKINTTLKLDQLRADVLDSTGEQAKSAARRDIELNNLSRRLVALAEEGKRVDREQKILESLIFQSMKQRESEIKEAHKRTLQWIFNKPETGFTDWLKAESGIYWVKGKAGSGKSTLMKYICDHSTTLEALRRWAEPQKLVTASYFFWNSGLTMQKTQTGLLQSLLYQVLLACPVLILETCSDHLAGEPWTRDELFKALNQVSKQMLLPAKFCFFVDGLDEYEGDDKEIISLLQDLAASPSVKICVSSRPWNAFLDAFDDSKWKLVLEDLTKDDMSNYVQNMLAEDDTFAKVAKKDPRCDSLVPQITEKAHGVWLWVYLVVRNLLKDLRDEEEYPFLQRRLDSFPEELEKYFEHILGKIDKIYREETAQIFLITVEAVRPLPVLAFKFLSIENEDPEYAIKADITPIQHDEALSIYKKWRKLLNSRCKDLLEVNISTSEDTVLKYKVDFLHRTVRDFLRDNYQGELRKRTAEVFDAKTSLCKILLALIKSLHTVYFQSVLNQLFGLVDELMYYAREMERKSGHSDSGLLDELDRVNSVHGKDFKGHWTNARDPPKPSDTFQEYGQCTFLALTIQSRLRLYMNEKLDSNPELLQQKRGRPMLDYALRPKRVTPAELPYQLQHQDTNIDVHIVSSLLSRGSDPNQKIHIYNGRTVWSLFLLSCYENADRVPSHVKDAWYQAVEYLVDHGADSNIKVENPADSLVKRVGKSARYKQDVVVDAESRYLTVQEILQNVFPSDKAARLEIRMKEVAERQQNQSSIFWRMLGWT